MCSPVSKQEEEKLMRAVMPEGCEMFMQVPSLYKTCRRLEEQVLDLLKVLEEESERQHGHFWVNRFPWMDKNRARGKASTGTRETGKELRPCPLLLE